MLASRLQTFMRARKLVLRLIKPAAQLLQIALVLVFLVTDASQTLLFLHAFLLLALQCTLLSTQRFLGNA